jgi:hypothetical protein
MIKEMYTSNNELMEVTYMKLYDNRYVLHKEDGPAMTHKCGCNMSFINGSPHSIDDKPAYVNCEKHGNLKKWYHKGKLHRNNDKPAIIKIISNNEIQLAWYQYDKLHRNLKPAIIYKKKDAILLSSHYINGLLHNPIGPAVIQKNNNFKIINILFALKGKQISKNEFCRFLSKRLNIEKTIQ